MNHETNTVWKKWWCRLMINECKPSGVGIGGEIDLPLLHCALGVDFFSWTTFEKEKREVDLSLCFVTETEKTARRHCCLS